MLKAKFIIIQILFITIIPVTSFSQIDEFEMEKEDRSEAKTKIIDPSIKLWNVNGFGAFADSTSLDTLQDFIHIYHPAYKNALTNTYVGNYGTPYLNNDFFNRDTKTDYFFLKSRDAYLLTPEGIDYYNTRTPYTRMDFSQSENKSKNNETRFNVIHSQNVNPYLNFTFRYDQAKSAGQYNFQNTKNNFITLYSSYNKDNLNIYGGFVSNAITNEENGGLESEDLIFSGQKPEYWKTNLVASDSYFNSTYYFANGEYRFGKKVEVEGDTTGLTNFIPVVGALYSFKYERHKHEFLEDEENPESYFENSFYGDDYFKDSIRFHKISNILQLKHYENADRKYSFGKRAFLGQEYVSVSMPGADTTGLLRKNKNFSNVYIGGGIFRESGKFWTWNFEGKFYLLGRNLGQTELTGIIAKPMRFLGDSAASINIRGSIKNLVADYFQEEFYSNHFWWENDLRMEQSMTVGGSFKSPKRKLELGANYALLNNYIYNNYSGIPAQTEQEILILSAYVDKDFNYRNLHFRTRVLWQQSSNEQYIHLPDLSAFVSAYFQFTISKVLFTQLGVDTRYNTKYYADAYSPATGLFYLQNEKEYGNYPYIDVYASIRLKRTKLFFNWMNIGTNFLDAEYYTTPYYPMNRATFRLGVSWAFYD